MEFSGEKIRQEPSGTHEGLSFRPRRRAPFYQQGGSFADVSVSEGSHWTWTSG